MLRVSRSHRAYHHGNLGPALEEAALDLVRTQGHGSMSLREVARAAGVSHNAPYHHFGDRTGLLKRLSERSMAELLDRLRAASAGGDPADSARRRAVAVCRAYARYAAEYPERFRIIYDPEVCVPGAPSETMAPLITEMEQMVAQAAEAMLPDGTPEAQAALATGLWGSVHGLAELVVAGHIEPDQVDPALIAVVDPDASA